MTDVLDVASPYFSGHESFTLRFTWLPKAVRSVSTTREPFSSDESMLQLGVGKNMVRSIRHWALASGIVEEVAPEKGTRASRIAVTALGDALFSESFGFDPFLEDPGTLWLIHWQLAARPSSPTTWFWAFSHFAEHEFTRERLVGALRDFIERRDWKRVAEASVDRDVDCFFRTYLPKARGRNDVIEDSLDCPLTELGLLIDVGGGLYAFNRGDHPTLPHGIFAYALVRYWMAAASESKTLSFDHLAYQAGSPGRVFKLSDSALTEFLEGLEERTRGAIRFGTTAGLRQVYRQRELDDAFANALLKRYYGGKGQ